MAVQRSPALAASRMGVASSAAKQQQAESVFYPNLKFSATESRGQTYNHVGESSIPDREQATRQYTFRLTQALYKPAAANELDQAQLGVEASRYEQQFAYEKLTTDLMKAFFDAFSAQTRLELYNKQLEGVMQQKRQAKRSFDVGTVSITDVREAEAKHDTLVARIRATEYELIAKRAELLRLTGAEVDPALYRATLSSLPQLSPDQLDLLLYEAEHSNARLQQAKKNYAIASLAAKNSRYGRFPTADLSVSSQRNIGDKQQITSSLESGWTFQAAVNLDFPIFDGGLTSGRINEAYASAEQSFQEVKALKEQNSVDLQQAFYSALSGIASFKGYDTAVLSTQTALAANQKGYEVGMRVNADVLDAQSKLYEVQQDRLEAWYEAWLSYVRIKQLTGHLDSSDIRELDQALGAYSEVQHGLVESSMRPYPIFDAEQLSGTSKGLLVNQLGYNYAFPLVDESHDASDQH